MSNFTIVYLPMDSRPCNYSWPVRLAEWAGAQCIVPVPDRMDEFRRPADYRFSEEFILDHAAGADAFVISVDHLCFGSLLASRSYGVDKEEALRRLNLLRRLKQAVPDTPIYAFSVIMRSSLSTLSASDLDAYRNMTAFSYNQGRAVACEERGDVSNAEKFRRLAKRAESRLPDGILHDYMTVRHRNSAINAECIRLVSENVLAGLQLLQEDSEPYGFHKNEQRELGRLMDCLGVTHVRIHNGADEGGMMQIAAALYGMEKPRPIRIVYTRGSGGFTARYEDRPFAENVRGMMQDLNIHEDPDAGQVLVIHTPRYGQQKEAQDETEDPAVPGIAEKISDLASEGKHIYLLDVAYANGGSRQLVDWLRKHGALPKLAGYAAWNTASNSLGTSLAQILCDARADRVNSRFLWERLLDDMLYQRVIRQETEAVLISEGLDPYALPDRGRAEKLISERYRKYLAEEEWPVRYEDLRIRQPWPRTFETDIRLVV